MMISLFASAEALAQNLPPPGAYQPIPNFTGVGAGLQFREAINDRFSGAQPIAPSIASPAFVNLPPEQDGMLLFCKDCRSATPCVSGGSGAFAFGQGGLWSCGGGATAWPASLTQNLLTGGHAINGNTSSGGDQINSVSVNGVRNATDYGVISGSQNTASVTISAGSTSATLAAAGDWANGEGIAVPGAGPTPSISTPSAPTVAATCTGTCATGYTYVVAALDGKCGKTAASSASTSVNNASSLTEANFNTLTIPTGNGYAAFGVCRGTSLIAIIPAGEENGNNSSPATYYRDIGMSPLTIVSPCLSSICTATSATADALYTPITAGAGTTTLTFANAASTGVTSQTSYHDDSAAIATAASPTSYATGARVSLPPNTTFVVSRPVVVGGTPGASNNVWGGIQLTGGSYTSVATTPMMQGMSVIKGINTFQMMTDGLNIDDTNGSALCAVEHNINNPAGGVSGAYVGESQDTNLNFSTGSPYYGICYTASAGYDQNNSENIVRAPQGTAANAGILIALSNALQNTIYGGNFAGTGEGAIELHGGSFNLIGGVPTSNAWMFDLEAGSYLHQSTVTGVSTEIGPATLYVAAGASFAGSSSGLSILNSDLGVDSALTGGLAIDVESTTAVLRLDDDHFRDGDSAENITFKGTLATIDHSWTGAAAITNGSGIMQVFRNYFASGAPTVTNGGTFCGLFNRGSGVSDTAAVNGCGYNLAVNVQDNGDFNIIPGGVGTVPDFTFDHSAIAGHPLFKAIGGEIDVENSANSALLGQIDAAGHLNSNVAQTTINGTSGTALCSEAMQGGSLKLATCHLNGYAQSGAAQTFAYPTAFSTTPTLLASCGTYEPSSTASTLTLPANASMTAETCNITAIGQ